MSRMSDSVEDASFDVEAQESLLGTGTGSAEAAETRSNSHRIMIMFLFYRSAERFKLGAINYAGDISATSSTPSSDDVFPTPDERIHHHQGSEDATAEETFSVRISVADQREHTNNLQSLQRENITDIVKKKNLHEFRAYGGARGFAVALNTDLENGVFVSEANNAQPKPLQLSQVLTTLFDCFLAACNNYTVLLLCIAAALSLVFGIKEDGLASGWFINGAVIVFTIVMLVMCPTVHMFLQERRSGRNSWALKGRNMKVKVVRDGRYSFVPETFLQVGDIAVLEKGVHVPGDGVFVPGHETVELDGRLTINENNPFIFYGPRVTNGSGRMIVTSTGMDTVWGEEMSQAMASADKKCKLEACLHKLSTSIHFTGLVISILIIVVLFLHYKAGSSSRPDMKGEPTRMKKIVDIIRGIITGSKVTSRVLATLSVSLLAIMEGIPFVITVAIFVWNHKTLARKASKRDDLAFVRMASVTTICSDKFGGLTENEIEVDNFFVGGEFVSESSAVGSTVLEGLCDGIGTLYLIPPSGCESKVLPLISWAKAKLGLKENSVREQCNVTSSQGCDPFKERCQVLMEKTGNEGQKKYWHYKGPAQDILDLCTHYYDMGGEMKAFDEQKKLTFGQAIRRMRPDEAVVMAFARGSCVNETETMSVETNCLTFMGMIRLKDTKEADVRKAVSDLKDAGITIILASGDDLAVLTPIGEKYGIIDPDSDDRVLTAEQFRSWPDEEKIENVEKIRIMGNCSHPSDKFHLIKFLRGKGKAVALLGQRSIDAPALKQADVGLTFGTWSSEVARESCDISIQDGDFSFLFRLVENGRCFQENIQKFVQFELIMTISSSLINFIVTVFWKDAPLTLVRLFLLNLVVAYGGGLALLMGPSTKTLMTMLPVTSTAKLITMDMWRNIAIQASYQTSIFVALQHKGQAILRVSRDHVGPIIYNGFFLCLMSNTLISREPGKRNIFVGLFCKNPWFWVAMVMFLMCQAVSAVVEMVVFDSSPGLNWKLWGVCLLIGLVSWLLDLAGKVASNFISKRAAGHG